MDKYNDISKKFFIDDNKSEEGVGMETIVFNSVGCLCPSRVFKMAENRFFEISGGMPVSITSAVKKAGKWTFKR